MAPNLNTYDSRSTLKTSGGEFEYFALEALQKRVGGVDRLPYSLKILLEGMLRHEDGVAVTAADIEAMARWSPLNPANREIAFTPGRVLLQDFTGVPAVVDLAAMRDALADFGGNPERINPLVPAELVIDHSVQVDSFGSARSFQLNVEKEFERNQERYAFLRWGQTAFENFRVVPPATGIVHQVNLEYLARVVLEVEQNGRRLCYPDTLVGTDSHTTMINGLGVLGWGVGGIEAEAAMLGQPISLLFPRVVGFKLYGNLPEGTTATDLVLTITQRLREQGVVGKFVEFYGSGISSLSLADRATIGNMSPEYGATCALFPIDSETSNYLRLTARNEEQIELVETYAKAQGWFHTPDSPEPEYSETLELDLDTVEPSLAGPRRPQDRVPLAQASSAFARALPTLVKAPALEAEDGEAVQVPRPRVLVSTVDKDGLPVEFKLGHGSVVIAAITSCTNTSNPSVMIGAGLVAKKAVERGLKRQPWVKTSLAPGSKVVSEYLEKADLLSYLGQLGFNLVGYGCTTCIGNSGPLPEVISTAVREQDLVVCSVLSGNRNFEGRINPDVRANYLASPPLVVAYALAGSMDVDLFRDPLGQDIDGKEVYFKELWPSQQEIEEVMRKAISPEMFRQKYADVFSGDDRWQSLPSPSGQRFAWDEGSTYVRKPSFFEAIRPEPDPVQDITGMRVLVMVGDSVTTDHISPAGSIPQDGPASAYLVGQGVGIEDFNSFGSRRGNHEVMMRGTFGNIRLRNLLVPGIEGGYTCHPSSPEPVSIYDAAMKYREEGVSLLVIAGKEYGSGSSRDWAAKGASLLGVEAVLAESFERIHRSNLIGMGVLPLEFEAGQNREILGLSGFETYDLLGLVEGMEPGQQLKLRVIAEDGSETELSVKSRIDTPNELIYYQNKGILSYVLRASAS